MSPVYNLEKITNNHCFSFYSTQSAFAHSEIIILKKQNGNKLWLLIPFVLAQKTYPIIRISIIVPSILFPLTSPFTIFMQGHFILYTRKLKY